MNTEDNQSVEGDVNQTGKKIFSYDRNTISILACITLNLYICGKVKLFFKSLHAGHFVQNHELEEFTYWQHMYTHSDTHSGETRK